jgi:hypothetical protein
MAIGLLVVAVVVGHTGFVLVLGNEQAIDHFSQLVANVVILHRSVATINEVLGEDVSALREHILLQLIIVLGVIVTSAVHHSESVVLENGTGFEVSVKLDRHCKYLLKLLVVDFDADASDSRVSEDDATEDSRDDAVREHESDAKSETEHHDDGVDDKIDAVLHSVYSSQVVVIV